MTAWRTRAGAFTRASSSAKARHATSKAESLICTSPYTRAAQGRAGSLTYRGLAWAGKPPPQQLPSMMEPRTHGANRRAKDCADLRVRQIMKIAQDHDLPILDRNPRECSAHFGAGLHRHQLFEWVDGAGVVDRFDAERGQ